MSQPADYTILVVDDDDSVRDLLAQHLTDEGYAILTAENGVDALKLIRSRQPDLVLLDVMMPGLLDGFGVLSALRAFDCATQTRIVFVTAVASLDQVRTAINNGVVDYVIKPFKLRNVSERVANVLRAGTPGSAPPLSSD
jgi:DNA-binding response OmpR family regulator